MPLEGSQCHQPRATLAKLRNILPLTMQFIEPQSEMLKGLFDDQQAILDKEAGISRLEAELEELESTD